jgi:hypothetical protein
MKKISRILLPVVLLLTPVLAWGGGDERLGTAGALELLIPMSARGVAMGGAVMAQTSGTEAWFWNPAGAALVEGSEVSFSHRQYIADIGLDRVSVAHNAGAIGVLGLSATVLSTDDELVRTTAQPEGTGETWAASFVIIGVSYARALTDRVSFGLNGQYIAEKIFNETAQGVAFDFGFTYRPTWKNLTLGVVVKNYGPSMKFDGPDFDQPVDLGDDESTDRNARTQSAAFELPSFIQFGLAWDVWQRGQQSVRVLGAFQSNNFTQDEYRFGGEWSMANQFFLRGGYVASSLDQYMYGFSAGAGLRLPLGEREARIDYAWADAGVFEGNHLFTLTFGF